MLVMLSNELEAASVLCLKNSNGQEFSVDMLQVGTITMIKSVKKSYSKSTWKSDFSRTWAPNY